MGCTSAFVHSRVALFTFFCLQSSYSLPSFCRKAYSPLSRKGLFTVMPNVFCHFRDDIISFQETTHFHIKDITLQQTVNLIHDFCSQVTLPSVFIGRVGSKGTGYIIYSRGDLIRLVTRNTMHVCVDTSKVRTPSSVFSGSNVSLLLVTLSLTFLITDS